MNKTATTQRKLIDVPVDALRLLSVKAAIDGTSVKKFIEKMIVIEAEKIEATADEALYQNLLDTDPDGKVYLTASEAALFEKRLGL